MSVIQTFKLSSRRIYQSLRRRRKLCWVYWTASWLLLLQRPAIRPACTPASFQKLSEVNCCGIFISVPCVYTQWCTCMSCDGISNVLVLHACACAELASVALVCSIDTGKKMQEFQHAAEWSYHQARISAHQRAFRYV